VSFTYESTQGSGARSLNGHRLSDEGTRYINSFRYVNLANGARNDSVVEADAQAILSEIKWCRENGADIVAVYFHWGDEYDLTPNQRDKDLARLVAENGADMIFASHPHIPQPMDVIEVTVRYPEEYLNPPVPEEPEEKEPWIITLRKHFGLIEEEPEPEPEPPKPETWVKTVPVFYSMGNFISNQRYETLGDVYGEKTARRTEQGMIAWVDLTYCVESKEITYNEISCIPTWVEKYSKNGRISYYVIPLIGDYKNNAELKASGHAQRAENALTNVTALIGDEYIKKQ
jgi:poly-gamma-glutamate synthesis protein (capsule biosynthesis protein)